MAAEQTPGADGSVTATRLYVGTREGEVLALDPVVMSQAFVGTSTFERAQIEGSGLVWSFKPETDPQLGGVFGAPAIDSDAQRIYVGFSTQDGEKGMLYALKRDRDRQNPANLEQGEWQAEVEGQIVGGPVLAPDLGLVIVGSDAGILYAFETETGAPASWRQFPLPGDTIGPIWTKPLVVGSTAYFGSLDHNVHAISLSNGVRLPSWPAPTSGGIIARPLLMGNQLVVGSFDRNLYGIDVASGSVRVLATADKWFWAGAVTDGSNTFVSSLNGQVFVLDRDGNKLREFAVRGPVVAQPTTISSGGRRWVVVANEDGGLYLISDAEQSTTAEGGLLSEVEILEGSRIKAPLVSVGRELFVSKEDGMVWALRLTGNTFEKLWSLDTTT